MSFPALTTAMMLGASPVPAQEAPVGAAPFIVDAATIDADVSVAAFAPASAELPAAVGPAPSTDPAQAADVPQATAPAQSTAAAVPPESAQPAQPPVSDEGADQEPDALAVQEEIIVTGRAPSPDDPLAALNAESYEITQKVDEAFVAPVAFAYKEALPHPVRQGVRNFLNNLSEPIVFLNFLLQLKPGKAAETFGRFAINTTVGVGGLVDMAKRKPFNLPYRNNGFANTLGYYGVKTGPYFYLPLIGSTTLRDFIGNRVDQFVIPMALGRPFNRPIFVIPAAVLNELDDRIQFDDEIRRIRAERDPYVAAREYYLKKRQAEIDALRGRGDSTIRVTVPAPPGSDPVPASTPPASEDPSGPRFSRQ